MIDWNANSTDEQIEASLRAYGTGEPDIETYREARAFLKERFAGKRLGLDVSMNDILQALKERSRPFEFDPPADFMAKIGGPLVS